MVFWLGAVQPVPTFVKSSPSRSKHSRTPPLILIVTSLRIPSVTLSVLRDAEMPSTEMRPGWLLMLIMFINLSSGMTVLSMIILIDVTNLLPALKHVSPLLRMNSVLPSVNSSEVTLTAASSVQTCANNLITMVSLKKKHFFNPWSIIKCLYSLPGESDERCSKYSYLDQCYRECPVRCEESFKVWSSVY